MVIYSYHVSRRGIEEKKKISYVLAFNGSSLTLWTLLSLGRDRRHVEKGQIKHDQNMETEILKLNL